MTGKDGSPASHVPSGTSAIRSAAGGGSAPWGGRKESGFGRTHSKHGLYECSSVKLVDRDSGRIPVPWWYPYSPQTIDGFKGLTELIVQLGERMAGFASAMNQVQMVSSTIETQD